MPTIESLADLVALVADDPAGGLYVRWSRGPEADLAEEQSSRDSLTGVPLPGLSANPLAVEPWWGDRPLRLWLARRLHDYGHLRKLRGPDVRPWVLAGTCVARGPDNEPLVRCHRAIAWIGSGVVAEADELIDRQASPEWGPLDRSTST